MNTSNHEQDPFEDFFSDRFSDFEADTDDVLWKNIKANLPASQTPKYWLWSSAALLLLLVGSSVWLLKDSFIASKNAQIVSSTSSESIHSQHAAKRTQAEKPVIVAPVHENNIPVETPVSNKPEATFASKNRATVAEKTVKADTEKSFVHAQKAVAPVTQEHTEIRDDVTEPLPIVQPVAPKVETVVAIEKNKMQEPKQTLTNAKATEQKSVDAPIFVEEIQSNPVVFAEVESVAKNIFQVDMLKAKPLGTTTNEFSLPEIESSHPILTKNKYYKKPITIEIFGSGMPLANYYNIESTQSSDSWQVHNINVQNSRLGAFAQLGLQLGFSEKWRIRGSIAYTRLRQIVVNYNVRMDSLIVRQGDSPEVSYLDVSKRYYNPTHYLAGRLDVQYDILKTKEITHYVGVGLEVNTVLFGRTNHNAFANISYGIRRQMGKNVSIFIEPVYGYALQKEQDSRFLTIRSNRLGLNMGLSYKLK